MPYTPPGADTSTLAPIASPTFTGVATAPSFAASGKTGATATPLTLAGGTASGAPTTGAHVKGELVADDTGALWFCTVAGTPGTWVRVGPKHQMFRRTAGDLVLGTTLAWTDLPTIGTTWDATFLAQVGDVIECSVSVAGGVANSAGVYLDVFTIVSAAPVTSFATGAAPSNSHNGAGGWYMPNLSYGLASGSIRHTLVSGDISAVTVTVRLRYKPDTANARTLYASSANWPMHFGATNLGPG